MTENIIYFVTDSHICSWIKLPSFLFRSFTEPTWINTNEFILVPSKTSSQDADGIYKFNIQTNEWSRILDYDSNLALDIRLSAYDRQKKELWLLCGTHDGPLFIFDTKNKKLSPPFSTSFNTFHKLICVKHTLHELFGLGLGNQHCIYDTKTTKLKKVHRLKYFEELYSHNPVHLKQQKMILVFGGKNDQGSFWSDSVYCYSIVDDQWSQLTVKLPKRILESATVVTRN